MYNAAITKNILKGCASIIFVGALFSCGNSDKDAAQSLYAQAEYLYNNKQYNNSIILLDSLKNNYKGDIELLKKGLHLRTLNQEGLILAEIEQADSLIAALETENNRLSGSFKYIKLPDMVEGYYIHKSIVGEIDKTDRTDIEPRIDEYDEFYIVSYLTGQDIKHTGISLTANAGSVKSATVPHDGAQNYRFKSGGKSYESITFKHDQCDTLGYFTVANNNAKIKATFHGKKNYSTQLSSKQIKAIAETYRYATCKTQGKATIQKRLFLEQKLDLARKQIIQTKLEE